MSEKKKHILNTSRLLFNELGYSQVTIRMIALKLSMSSGNLNYHFRKREDILEALYFEMVAEFDARVKRLDGQFISLPKIKEDMQTSMHRMVEYKFFWTDLYNLLMQNEKIRTHFEKAYKARMNGYHVLFKMLEEHHLLKSPAFKKEHLFLMERMIDFSNTWLYASSLYKKNKFSPKYIESQASILLSMLYPYLTDLGKSQYKDFNPKYFI